MPSCALRSCKSRYGKGTGRDFSLFSFPTVNKIEREKWIKFVQTERREENWLPTNASKLCSKHFSSQDIYCGKTGRTVLKRGSIPYTESKFQIDGIIEGDETNRVTPVNVDVSDSESIFDTPRKIALKAQVHKLQKQKIHHQARIKKLRQENRYLKLKVLNLKDLANHLEKKFDIQKNVANSLKATAETQALYERLNKKSTKVGLSRKKFGPALRKFALTLHYYSPAAYRYARKCFNNVFPHERTLRRWYVSVNAQPGFTRESFSALKIKSCKMGKELICSLVFDEISIRRQKLMNTKMNEGFVNLGFGDIREEIASQAHQIQHQNKCI